MQQLFMKLVLEQEQEIYKEEGLDWIHIHFSDNSAICDMIEAPSKVSTGISSIIDMSVWEVSSYICSVC